MIKRLICLVRGHRFIKSLAKTDNLEVKECERCKTHLNLHHGMNQCFVSKKYSILPELIEMEKLFSGLSAEKGAEG